MFRRLFFVFAALMSLAAFAQPAAAQQRIALIIGNAAYPKGPLQTSLADGGLVAEALTSVGFEIVEGADVNSGDLRRVFGEFLKLGRVKDTTKMREYGEYIETESRRLTQLINNILDFSRIESGQKSYHFYSTDIRELVADTLKVFEVRLKQVHLALCHSKLVNLRLVHLTQVQRMLEH